MYKSQSQSQFQFKPVPDRIFTLALMASLSLCALLSVTACQRQGLDLESDEWQWQAFKASRQCQEAGFVVGQPITIWWCDRRFLSNDTEHLIANGNLYMRYDNEKGLTPAEYEAALKLPHVIDSSPRALEIAPGSKLHFTVPPFRYIPGNMIASEAASVPNPYHIQH